MRSKPYVLPILAPVLTYLVVLLLIAAFVVRPSTLGWIGLAVASAAALVVAGIAVTVFPRSRANGTRRHPRTADCFRLLVVTDAHSDGETLGTVVHARLGGRAADVFVVAPVLASPLHFLTGDEQREAEDARVRLTETLQALAHRGIAARGVVGTDDPLQAIGDALAHFPAAEILLVVSSSSRSWLEQGLERRARDLYDVHVSTAVAATAGERR